VHLALDFGVRRSSDFGGASPSPAPRHARAVDQVTDGNHEALACGVVASGTGVVGAAEPLVYGVEEPLEHQ
jgi:hypothetical protein